MKLFSKDKGEEISEGMGNIAEVTKGVARDTLRQMSGSNERHTNVMVDNLIGFTNFSGGTGASTIVANLAYLLTTAEFGKLNVLVVDLNVLKPVQHIFYSVEKKKDYSLIDYMTGKAEIGNPDMVGYMFGDNSIGEAIETNGKISLLRACNRSVMDKIYCEEKENVKKLMNQINKMRPLYDVIIMDIPSEIDSMISNEAMYVCDKIYTVWDEGITSIVNTDRMIEQMKFTGIECDNKLKVIMNKRTDLKYSRYPFEKMNLELVGVLPFNTDVIYSSLNAQVYCKNGTATTKNGVEFEREMRNFTRRVLEIGGVNFES